MLKRVDLFLRGVPVVWENSSITTRLKGYVVALDSPRARRATISAIINILL